MSTPKNIGLTAEELRRLVHYDPLTGHFTYRTRDGGDRGDNFFNTRYAGKRAGSVTHHGYYHIRLNGSYYLAHRLAWLYTYGYSPAFFIDHKNGDRVDNRIANLRSATRRQNAFNKNVLKSLPKHVSYYRPRDNYVVRVTDQNGKRHHCGYFASLEEASAVALEQAARLQGPFARLS